MDNSAQNETLRLGNVKSILGDAYETVIVRLVIVERVRSIRSVETMQPDFMVAHLIDVDIHAGLYRAVNSRQASWRSPHRVEKVSETSNQLPSLPLPWLAPMQEHSHSCQIALKVSPLIALKFSPLGTCADVPRSPDPLAVLEMLETDPTNRLHTRHPRTLPKNRKDQPEPITGGLTFNAISAPHRGNIAGDLTRIRGRVPPGMPSRRFPARDRAG